MTGAGDPEPILVMACMLGLNAVIYEVSGSAEERCFPLTSDSWHAFVFPDK